MDEKIKHVNKDIIALPTPPSPPLNQVSSSPSQPSQVHPSHIQPPASASTAPKRQQLCKRCGHPRKGHTYPKNSAVRCSNGVCATHDTCTSTQKHSTALQPTLHYGHIAEYILPYHLSKATIFGFPIGSNACTAIAAVEISPWWTPNALSSRNYEHHCIICQHHEGRKYPLQIPRHAFSSA